MPTITQPGSRTRVNFTQSAKGEWRVSEITVELTDHDDPVSETSDLFHMLREQADHDVEQRNSAHGTLSIQRPTVTEKET